MLARFSTLAAALLLAVSVSAGTKNAYDSSTAPISLVDAWPQILVPAEGDIFYAGGNLTVTWSQSLASQYNSSQLGQTASIQLFWLEEGSSSYHGTQT